MYRLFRSFGEGGVEKFTYACLFPSIYIFPYLHVYVNSVSIRPYKFVTSAYFGLVLRIVVGLLLFLFGWIPITALLPASLLWEWSGRRTIGFTGVYEVLFFLSLSLECEVTAVGL